MRWIVVAVLCIAAGLAAWIYFVPHRHLAPEGTFFVLQRFSFQTDHGVDGVPPGTKVTQVADRGDIVTVTDGRRQFDVKRTDLTNDLDVAASAANSDVEKQRQVREGLLKQKRSIAELQRRMYEENARKTEARQQGRPPPSATPVPAGPRP